MPRRAACGLASTQADEFSVRSTRILVACLHTGVCQQDQGGNHPRSPHAICNPPRCDSLGRSRFGRSPRPAHPLQCALGDGNPTRAFLVVPACASQESTRSPTRCGRMCRLRSRAPSTRCSTATRTTTARTHRRGSRRQTTS
eukprot:4565256-Prymnesium_polylepis.1